MIEVLDLTFAVEDEHDPKWPQVLPTLELKPGGAAIPVTVENKQEYITCYMEHLTHGRCKSETMAFCNGFWEVVPSHRIGVFTPEEVEKFICGLGEVDVADWKANTSYQGEFSAGHRTVKHFWEFVEEND